MARGRWASVLCLILVLAGCGGQAPSPPAAAATNSAATTPPIAGATKSATTSTPIAGASSSVAGPAGSGAARVTLPANWSEVELTEESLQASISILAATNPELVSAVRWLLDTGAYKTYRLWAYGYDGTSTMGNVNIMETPAQGTTLDTLETQLAAVFQQSPGISGVASSRITLPAGAALLFTMDQTMSLADGTQFKQVLRSYAVIEGDVVYSVNFSCNPQAPAACLADVETMIGSLTIGT
jgi:hypothetical protein